jgi:hypothetical protein
MRVQICIPTAVWERVQAIAREEYRAPKEQIALFVWEGVQNREKGGPLVSSVSREAVGAASKT